MSAKIAFEIQRRVDLIQASDIPYAVVVPYPSGKPRQIDTAKGLLLWLTEGLDDFE